MRATFELPDELVEDLLQVSGEKKKTRAISIAIEDYIRRKRMEKLLSLSGKIEIDVGWEEMEADELKGMRHRENIRKHR